MLAQVACGIPDLKNFLNCELEFIWDTQDDNCLIPLRFNYTLLGLIEAAQIYSRQQIDTMTRQATTQIEERYDALSVLRGDSERDASARACQWNVATSSQEFIRNSQDEAIGFSDYRHQYVSNFQNNGVDRTCRHTTGFGFHISRIVTKHDGLYVERGDTVSDTASNSNGGTGPLQPLYNVEWTVPFGTIDFPFFDLDFPQDPNDLIQETQFPQGTLCKDMPGPTSETEPGEINLNWNFCSEDDLRPSMGYGNNGRFDINFGVIFLPVSITIKLSWEIGRNARQYHTCQSSLTGTLATHTQDINNNDTSSTDAAENENEVYSSERSDNIHYVRKYGITVRRGRTDLDGEEHSIGTAKGSANSHSDRLGQRTGSATERSEAETVRHSESLMTRHERANNDMIRNKYGQVSQHLQKLWQRIWDETQRLERQFASVPHGAAMNCVRSETCCTVRRSYHARNV